MLVIVELLKCRNTQKCSRYNCQGMADGMRAVQRISSASDVKMQTEVCSQNYAAIRSPG